MKHHTSNIKGGVRMKVKKEVYVKPVLAKHELLRDITAGYSGNRYTRDRIESAICRFFPQLCR